MNKEQKEAIEELEDFIKGPCETCKYCKSAYKLNRKNIIQLLNLNKKLQKENEELKKSKITYEKVRDIQEKNKNIVDNNYIPKQKIKDKIEEINKMIAYEYDDAVIIQLGKQKRVLQKLLESEE